MPFETHIQSQTMPAILLQSPLHDTTLHNLQSNPSKESTSTVGKCSVALFKSVTRSSTVKLVCFAGLFKTATITLSNIFLSHAL